MRNPKILLFGKNGQLGSELKNTLSGLGNLTAVQAQEVNLENPDHVMKFIREMKPSYIVNAAAYTAVDQAEVEGTRARSINAIAPGLLAEEAKKLKAVLVHYSTDYVFDGQKGTPYTEEDLPSPINLYGLSKLEGEQAIQNVGGTYFVFRTSWVYSVRSGSGFVNKVLQWSREQQTLRMVTDQVGNPTWSYMLAEYTAQILSQGFPYLLDRAGLYHLAGGGFVSRFEWAKTVLELDPNRHEQITTSLEPAVTEEFPLPARRPIFSALNCKKFENVFSLNVPDWKSSLRKAMS